MNKVQLNNTSIDLAAEMLASLKRGDIGSIQLAIVMVVTELESSDLHGEYEQLCSAALAHANQWNLNKTLSAVSFYIHELVSLVSNGGLGCSTLNKILLELSIALKFNAFHVSKQCRKYNLSREQTIKLLTVNSYE